MKWYPFAVVGLACLAVAGCRADPAIALLERENRLLEDEIYRLRELVADYQGRVRPGPINAPLPGQSGTGTVELGGPDGLRLPPEIAPPAGSRPTPAAPSGSAPLLAPPVLQPGEPLREDELPDAPGQSNGSTGPSQETGPAQVPTEQNMPRPIPSGTEQGDDDAEGGPSSQTEPLIQADSSHVVQFVLNRQLTGGYNADGRPGDEGITVTVEPRDAQGRCIEAPADVSVVLLDPALEGEAARVARWDFTAAETAAMFLNTDPGQGMGLDMLWPGDPPVHGELHLFVRYTTSDGRKLQVDVPIRVALPGQRSADWVPVEPSEPPLQAGRPAHPSPLSSQVPPSIPPPAGIAAGPAEHSPRPAKSAIQRPVWSPDRR